MKINPLWRTALNYGAMSGIGTFLVFLALYFRGVNPLGSASWLGAWIPIVFISISTKYYRDRILGGFITYWQGFRTGLLTGVCSSLLFALAVFIFVKLFSPEILDAFKEMEKQGWEASKEVFSDEIYEMGMEEVEKITIGKMAYGIFLRTMIGTALVSFVTAAAYRKLPSEIDE